MSKELKIYLLDKEQMFKADCKDFSQYWSLLVKNSELLLPENMKECYLVYNIRSILIYAPRRKFILTCKRILKWHSHPQSELAVVITQIQSSEWDKEIETYSIKWHLCQKEKYSKQEALSEKLSNKYFREKNTNWNKYKLTTAQKVFLWGEHFFKG